MAYPALTAFLDKDRMPPTGFVVTAVLQGGCPLNCPFCIIQKRNERQKQSYVSCDHLIGVLRAMERRNLLGATAVVGDEPLQAHCWSSAKSFLDFGATRKLPTALISNGYNLIDFIDELCALPDTKITISLDAASEEHDGIRRKPGAFARISKGIRLAITEPSLKRRLSLAAIMMPGKFDRIDRIIAYAADNEIQELLLSPLLTSSRTEPLAVHPRVLKEAWSNIPRLTARAKTAGVRLRLSDEFAVLDPWKEELGLTDIEILAPKGPARLIRVDAGGRVETLTTMYKGTTTGLQLPENVGDVDDFVCKLIEHHFIPAAIAA